jgi:hypothetical protein
VGELARCLAQLVESPELCQSMGLLGRRRALELYHWPSIIAQWEALWAELSAIARSIEPKHPEAGDYRHPDYFTCFSHYASRVVGDETPVYLTARGKRALASKSQPIPHASVCGVLEPKYLRAILSSLRLVGWANASLPTGELVKSLCKTHGLSRGRAMMHLLWLAKYDLISLAAEQESCL